MVTIHETSTTAVVTSNMVVHLQWSLHTWWFIVLDTLFVFIKMQFHLPATQQLSTTERNESMSTIAAHRDVQIITKITWCKNTYTYTSFKTPDGRPQVHNNKKSEDTAIANQQQRRSASTAKEDQCIEETSESIMNESDANYCRAKHLNCQKKEREHADSQWLSNTINDLLIRLNKQQTSGTLLRKTYTDALRHENFGSLPPTPNSHPKLVSQHSQRAWFHPGIIPHPEAACSHSKQACNKQSDHGWNSYRETCWWDWKQIRGYVDIGTGVHDDTLPPATEALVFMVVAVNGNWKLIIAYFFIDGLNGGDRANVVTQCLCRLYDIDVTVTSIICDGASTILAIFRELGAPQAPNAFHFFHIMQIILIKFTNSLMFVTC